MITSFISSILSNFTGFQSNRRLISVSLLHVYKALNGQEPLFIGDVILPSQPGRFTRASNSPNLAYPVKVPTNDYGKQTFVYAAATLWNILHFKLRSAKSLLDFRKQFKTLLFKHAYDM